MKRYTGQQALYEAISRSRAKAKRGNVLERLLPEVTKQAKPAPEEGQTQVKPLEAPAEGQKPAAKEPSRLLPEKPPEPVIVKENAKLRRLGTEEKPEVPPERLASPGVKPRPIERTDRPAASQPSPVRAWLRLRPVQFNAGRVEISVPYHIGIVAALVLILVVLTAFRFGQKYPTAKAQATVAAKTPAPVAAQNGAAETATSRATPANTAVVPPTGGAPAQSEGDHWIVLAQHKNEADLQAVVEYFAKHDVQLKTYQLARTRQLFAESGWNAARLPSGEGYLLATKYLYSNPDRVGTDGYAIKQKIIEFGRNYKAPPGKETFTAKHFADAYGMKVK